MQGYLKTSSAYTVIKTWFNLNLMFVECISSAIQGTTVFPVDVYRVAWSRSLKSNTLAEAVQEALDSGSRKCRLLAGPQCSGAAEDATGRNLTVVLLFVSVDLLPLPREQLSLTKGLTTLVPCGCFIYAVPMFGLHNCQKDCFRHMPASLWPLLCPWIPSPYRDALCFLLKSMACVSLPVLQRKLCPNGIISSLECSYWDSERKSLHYDKGSDEI